MAERGHRDAARLSRALAPYANGRSYLNFVEDEADVASGFPERAWLQLTGIRSAIDPDAALFVGNHPVPRLFEDGTPTS